MALLYLLLVTLCQLYLILRREVPQVEQKLPQLLQNLYEQQNIILGFSIQLQDQEYSMTDLLLSPAATSVNETINGTTHTWQGLNLDQRPNWTQSNQGDAFQFTEVYQAPGMESVTDITRTIESTSVTDTTTIFSQ